MLVDITNLVYSSYMWFTYRMRTLSSTAHCYLDAPRAHSDVIDCVHVIYPVGWKRRTSRSARCQAVSHGVPQVKILLRLFLTVICWIQEVLMFDRSARKRSENHLPWLSFILDQLRTSLEVYRPRTILQSTSLFISRLSIWENERKPLLFCSSLVKSYWTSRR